MAKKDKRKKATAKTSRKAKDKLGARPSSAGGNPRAARPAAPRPQQPRAKAGSAFQLMIETINEADRLRAKNERRDVTDETG